MESKDISVVVDEFLFGKGFTVADYFIEQTPVSEMICYRNSDGREFDLLIHDPALGVAMRARLKELGVVIVKLG